MFDPKPFARALQDLLNELFVGIIHTCARKQTCNALTHKSGRVGHAAHHAIGAQPTCNAVTSNASSHRQMQRLVSVRGNRCCGLFKNLWLDGPNDHIAVDQLSAGAGDHFDTQFPLKFGRCIGKGFKHADLCRRQPLFEQTAQNGAGHVAAANEGQPCLFEIGEGCRSHAAYCRFFACGLAPFF